MARVTTAFGVIRSCGRDNTKSLVARFIVFRLSVRYVLRAVIREKASTLSASLVGCLIPVRRGPGLLPLTMAVGKII